MSDLPTLATLREAHARIAPYVHRTPVLTSTLLDREVGAQLFFKCENLQKAGAFKSRGACNAVFSLTAAEAARGVVTHSSGNHAGALARAAKLRGIPAYIVMPHGAAKPKAEAVLAYGGKITYCENTSASREGTCAAIAKETGAAIIPPYNDHRIVAGQATAALELLEQAPDLDIIVAPCGGGGLLSGTSLAVHYLRPSARTIGAEPLQASDAAASIKAGKIVEKPVDTIADGLRTMLGDRTFPIIHAHVSDIATATEAGIVAAMRLLWERMKLVVEPSGAVPFAAIREHRDLFTGKRVGIIISGGNVDLDALPWIKR